MLIEMKQKEIKNSYLAAFKQAGVIKLSFFPPIYLSIHQLLWPTYWKKLVVKYNK